MFTTSSISYFYYCQKLPSVIKPSSILLAIPDCAWVKAAAKAIYRHGARRDACGTLADPWFHAIDVAHLSPCRSIITTPIRRRRRHRHRVHLGTSIFQPNPSRCDASNCILISWFSICEYASNPCHASAIHQPTNTAGHPCLLLTPSYFLNYFLSDCFFW